MSALALPEEATESEPVDDDTGSGRHLTQRLTVTEVVAVYEQAERDIRAAFAKIAAAEKALNDTFTMEEWCTLKVHSRYNSHVNFNDPDYQLVELRRSIWIAIVDRLEIRRFCSIARWEQLQKQIRDGEPPEISTETVSGLARQFESQMEEMLSQAVSEVYEWLRPWNSRHKTNERYEIGPKVVLTWMVERDGWTTPRTYRVRHDREQNLTALENVLNALDGNGSINKDHRSMLSRAIREAGPGGVGETEFYKFRCFKNGNLHLVAKRLDLIDRLNKMAGGKRLRGERRAR